MKNNKQRLAYKYKNSRLFKASNKPKLYLFSVIASFLKGLVFNLIFKKIPKTQYGRCVECDANQICHKNPYKCKCSDEEQYKVIDLRNWL